MNKMPSESESKENKVVVLFEFGATFLGTSNYIFINWIIYRFRYSYRYLPCQNIISFTNILRFYRLLFFMYLWIYLSGVLVCRRTLIVTDTRILFTVFHCWAYSKGFIPWGSFWKDNCRTNQRPLQNAYMDIQTLKNNL